jgi:hypothetical protein
MSTPPSAQPPLSQNKPRKKRSADVVTFEELLAAHKTERGPGQLPAEGVVLIGVDLELQRRMAERVGFPAPESGAPNFTDLNNDTQSVDAPIESVNSAPRGIPGAAELTAPTISAPGKASLNDGGASRIERNIDAPPTNAPISGAPKFDVRDLLIPRTRTKTHAVHAVSRIEDVFTAAERDLLRWLWEQGRPIPVTPGIRLAMGLHGEGARRLAAQSGLIYNTFKNLTRALSTKFALDIVRQEKNLPTIYAIYDNPGILERQRQAGFTGVVHKNGGGRELVDAQAQPAPRRSDLTVDELEHKISTQRY